MKKPYAFHFGVGICGGEMREVQGGRSLSTFHLLPSTKRKRAGFTLIELIGVMAIIGILSAVVLPSLISKIEDANSVGEDANLEEVARALVAGIKATGTIPNPNLTPVLVPGNPPTWTPSGSWTAIAANYCSLIGYSLFNTLPANNQRQIVLSQGLANYVVANLNSYATDADGWPDPIFNDLKIYILASSKSGLPLQANIPVADIANWTKVFDATTGTVTVPESVFGAANTTKGEFLHVKVVDLNQLFCRVELTDFASPINATVTLAGGGAGATYASAAVVGNQLGYDFRFNTTLQGGGYLGLALGDLGNVCGSTKQLITRPYVIPAAGNLDDPATTTEAPTAQFQLNLPAPPWWDIAPPILLGGQQMPANANNQAFYVIKGTTLTLYAAGAVLPAAPILTVQINADSAFQYCNGAWTRVD